MGRRKKQVETVHFDATIFAGGGIRPETRVSISEMLEGGTADERRSAIFTIARQLESGRDLPDALRKWIADALQQIGLGADANRALGLTTKQKRSLQELKDLTFLIDDLRRQGMSHEDARDLVARYDPRTENFRPAERGEALRKHIQRRGAKKKGDKIRRNLSGEKRNVLRHHARHVHPGVPTWRPKPLQVHSNSGAFLEFSRSPERAEAPSLAM